MKKYIFFLCILLIALFPVTGQDIIYCENSNPPFSFSNGDNVAGIYPDIVREIYRRMGREAVLVAYPWPRAILEAKRSASGIAGIVKNSEREQYLDYTDPINTERFVVYYLDASKKIESVSDLKGLHVGVIRGWSYGNSIEGAIQAKLFYVEENISDRLNFRKLLTRRIDAVIAIEESGERVLKELQPEREVYTSGALFELDIYMAFNKTLNKQNDIAEINSIIADLHEDGTIDRICHGEGISR